MEVKLLSSNQRPYADTFKTYLVKPTELAGMSDEEIESAVRKKFEVGIRWFENELELCKPNHDGSAFTIKIREPYLD